MYREKGKGMGYSFLNTTHGGMDPRWVVSTLQRAARLEGVDLRGTPYTLEFQGGGAPPTLVRYYEGGRVECPLCSFDQFLIEVVEDGGPSWVPGQPMIVYPRVDNRETIWVLRVMLEEGGELTVM